jgi:hypothetical protein
MKALRNLMLVAVVVGTMTVMGARSFAGPLLPPLSAVAPVAGETDIIGVGGVLVGRVDWLVLPPGDYTGTVFAPLVEDIFGPFDPGDPIVSPLYIYAYQIEPAINDIENWTVNVKGPYLGSGTSFLDLDVVGHDETIFPNLGDTHPNPPPKENELPSASLQFMNFGPIEKPDNVTYDFDGLLDIGEESEVLWLLSAMPPTYGIGALSDGLPAPGIGLVPVPSPEPTTLALLLMGIVGVNVVRRRRK